MPAAPDALQLAEALERAYRLALAVQTLADDGASEAPGSDPDMAVMATELLGVLDQARASMLRPGAPPAQARAGW